jgi:HAMP domain-containing protein
MTTTDAGPTRVGEARRIAALLELLEEHGNVITVLNKIARVAERTGVARVERFDSGMVRRIERIVPPAPEPAEEAAAPSLAGEQIATLNERLHVVAQMVMDHTTEVTAKAVGATASRFETVEERIGELAKAVGAIAAELGVTIGPGS